PASVIYLRDELIRRAQPGAAILVSSHHLDEVARIADRIILMNRGQLIGELLTFGADLERAFFEHIRADDAQRHENHEPTPRRRKHKYRASPPRSGQKHVSSGGPWSESSAHSPW